MGLPLGALLVLLPAAAASVVSVSSADELRAAFADASATEVRLAADIFLGADESFTSSYARTLDGDGFGIYQAEGAAPILEVEAPLALVDATLAKTFAPTAEPTYGPTAARYAPTAAPSDFVGVSRPPSAAPSTRAPTSRTHGGCVVVRAGASLRAANATFVRCATDDGDGGAVAVYDANATLANCSFVACRAAGDARRPFWESYHR